MKTPPHGRLFFASERRVCGGGRGACRVGMRLVGRFLPVMQGGWLGETLSRTRSHPLTILSVNGVYGMSARTCGGFLLWLAERCGYVCLRVCGNLIVCYGHA